MCETCTSFNPFQPDFLHPEGADAPDGRQTSFRLEAGQSLTGDLTPGDNDWIRLEVTPGTTYEISTADGPGASAKDTYLVLYDKAGRQIDVDDDDGQGFHASLSFEATAKVYYAAVTTYQSFFGYPATDSGSYTLRLAAEGTPGGTPPPSSSGGGKPALPMLSNAAIAEQLVHDYWADSGRSARGFDVDVSGGRAAVIHVDLAGLPEAGRWFAERALEAWSAVSGLTFSQASPPKGTPWGIRFDDEASGAHASSTIDNSTGKTISVAINVSKGWIAGDHYDYDSYALQTYMHEIGHALGLGHAGSYNTGEGFSVTYDSHAEFANDSWQTTIMSYFNQQDNTAIEASRAYLLTPAPADILAIQEIYGTAGTLRTGNTVYGAGSTAGDHYDHLTKLWSDMAFTLLDDGGIDTLNLFKTSADQRIDLRPETVSDIGGKIGTMSIAKDTWIEHARSGRGADEITGNARDNRIHAGAADDTVEGLLGSDTLRGGAGHDTLAGDGAADTLIGGSGRDRLNGGTGNDRLEGGPGADRLEGGGGRDMLLGGRGEDVFVFAPGGGSDQILDFTPDRDRLDLRAFDLPDADAAWDAMHKRGDNTVFVLDGAKIVIADLNPSEIDAGDLLL